MLKPQEKRTPQPRTISVRLQGAEAAELDALMTRLHMTCSELITALIGQEYREQMRGDS